MPAATSRCRASPSRRPIRSSACAASACRWRGRRSSACRSGRCCAPPSHGNLKVMFPMIAVPEEYARAAALFAEEARDAGRAKASPHKMPPLGIMVEVPSVAIAPEDFADVAFFSIGSNDLTQYVMAAARDNGVGRGAEFGAQPGRAAADRAGRGLRHGERHSGQPVRRRRRRSGRDPGAARGRPARSFRRAGAACHGQGGDRRRHRSEHGRGRANEPTATPRRRSAPTRRSCRRSSTSARPARASGLPTRSASTAASSRRSPARPIRRRSRQSICR